MAWRTSWEAMKQAMLVERSVAEEKKHGLVLRGKRKKDVGFSFETFG